MYKFILLFALLLSSIVAWSQITILPLHDNWQFTQADITEWRTAKVPGVVQMDLLDHQLIPDPNYRNQEDSIQWVEEKDWIYQTQFQLDESTLNQERIELVFEGLDTYADVYLNDSLLFTANNMYRSWTIDCQSLVKAENKLRILFHSPLKINQTQLDTLGYELPAGNDAAEKKVSIFTRKAPYHFGWDWGPRIVTAGIWRPVYIQAWSEAKINDSYIEQKSLNDQQAQLNAQVDIHSTQSQNIKLTLKDHRNRVIAEKATEIQAGEQTLNIPFVIQNPKRWWSNGLGEAHLYRYQIELSSETKLLDKDQTQIGLRTLELIQEKDEIGTSYYFKLNGEPIFMKGANYIPSENMLPKVDSNRYEFLIQSAVDANMNMLRVWGGGIYENDYFYDLCDEKGILVWQDFMFACSMYPGDPAFLQNVEAEAIQNIKRLRKHPSLALWCGNNEVDVAWHNWGWQKQYGYSKKDSAYIWQSYLNLFQKLLPKITEALDPSRPYVSTSPLSNWGKIENFNHSSMHYWGVWHGEDPFKEYAKYVGRFMSEYGFQSFPTISTVEAFSDSSDWDLESEVMKQRQKSYKGNKLLHIHMNELYQKPKDFQSFVYLSNLTQAEGLKVAFENHRARKPHCMGTLYWQLNDCWPAISWSGIDYYGHWKPLHYYAQKAFQEVILHITSHKNRLNIQAISDRLSSINGQLKLQLIDFQGNIKKDTLINIQLKANTSKSTLNESVYKWTNKKEKHHHLLQAQLIEKDQIIAEQLHYFTPPKHLNLPQVRVNATIEKIANGYEITLHTKQFAKNVYLQSPLKGHFTQNYIDLIPNQPITLQYQTNDKSSNFQNTLQIQSLIDAY